MKQNNRFFIAISLPGIIYMLSIVLLPIIFTCYLSFHKYNFIHTPLNRITWVGLNNYVSIFKDGNFWKSMFNTGVFLLLGILFEMLIGLGIALLIFKKYKRSSLINSLILLPSMTAPLVVGLIFRFMFNPQFGVFHYFLSKLGWHNAVLGNSSTALLGIIIADIWQWTPFIAIVLYSGLVALPTEPFEAAKIDGASGFQTLTKVTLPLLKPVFMIALLIRMADIIREFDKIFVMTYGGPGTASEVLNFTAYRINYINFDMGVGSAYVVIIFVIIVLLSIGVFKTFYTKEI